MEQVPTMGFGGAFAGTEHGWLLFWRLFDDPAMLLAAFFVMFIVMEIVVDHLLRRNKGINIFGEEV